MTKCIACATKKPSSTRDVSSPPRPSAIAHADCNVDRARRPSTALPLGSERTVGSLVSSSRAIHFCSRFSTHRTVRGPNGGATGSRLPGGTSVGDLQTSNHRRRAPAGPPISVFCVNTPCHEMPSTGSRGPEKCSTRHHRGQRRRRQRRQQRRQRPPRLAEAPAAPPALGPPCEIAGLEEAKRVLRKRGRWRSDIAFIYARTSLDLRAWRRRHGL